jgi:hypothetical protein
MRTSTAPFPAPDLRVQIRPAPPALSPPFRVIAPVGDGEWVELIRCESPAGSPDAPSSGWKTVTLAQLNQMADRLRDSALTDPPAGGT